MSFCQHRSLSFSTESTPPDGHFWPATPRSADYVCDYVRIIDGEYDHDYESGDYDGYGFENNDFDEVNPFIAELIDPDLSSASSFDIDPTCELGLLLATARHVVESGPPPTWNMTDEEIEFCRELVSHAPPPRSSQALEQSWSLHFPTPNFPPEQEQPGPDNA